jgi:polyribonucleotide nucleotidyltransferase
MFNCYTKEMEWGGRKLTLETGKVARQADGAVLATYGDTSVLCTVVAKREPKVGIDFFPLTVNYQEKAFAVGRIPGGFFKREGRPSEKETLLSRLIDRPIRPLFAEGFKNEVQVVCTLYSYDQQNESEAVALIGASAALAIAGVPFLGPLGAAKVGYQDGEYILNPTVDQLKTSELELSVAGTAEGVLMVESEAQQLSEEVMLGAVSFGHENYQPIIKMISELAKECGKEAWEMPKQDASVVDLKKAIAKHAEKEFVKAYKITAKQDRTNSLNEIKTGILAKFVEELEHDETVVKSLTKKLEQEIVRTQLLKKSIRIDGRGTADVRQIESEVNFLKRTHGSALFTRGETQALAVATLGTGQDEQMIDSLDGEYKESFLLHYNFPPFSVGEVGRMGSPGRREIGHGKLAWRAIRPVLPGKEKFPYTLRVVSEVTESNGSSSMATVCGSILALMDAGVPIQKPVAGIAMGLVKEKDDFVVISDILGDEDALGDMDFKVAGTEDGITALQMDIKITSITPEIMQIALGQAKEGRLHILDRMTASLETPRDRVNQFAPRITTLKIPKDKIRDVIGSGGSVIRDIVEKTGAKIDIADDGTITVAAVNADSSRAALEFIKDIVTEPEVGCEYPGKVAKVSEYGLIVSFLGARSGLVHFSELPEEFRKTFGEKFNEGDDVAIRVIGFDRGRPRLSMRPEGSSPQTQDRPNNNDRQDRGQRRPQQRDRGRSRPGR